MSETFEKVLVKDDLLGCITSKVKFQVFKGGQNITCQPFTAVSATPASHVYTETPTSPKPFHITGSTNDESSKPCPTCRDST